MGNTAARHRQRDLLPAHSVRLAGVLLVLLSLLLPAVARGATADVTLSAGAFLGGHVRVGAWTAVEVTVTNAGPTIQGELRLTSQQQGRSTYGVEVDLPTGSNKSYTLYTQPSVFGRQIQVALVEGAQTLATVEIPVTPHNANEQLLVVVADRPESLIPDLTGANLGPPGRTTTVISVSPADLPPRIEAWSAVDRLVWQDRDATELSTEQLRAMRGWLDAGGQLVILGGTTGGATLAGFPDDLLPYRPTTTVDVPPDDLAGLLGEIPPDAQPLPALSGTLEGGSAMAQSGGQVIAAEMDHGQGSVTLIGFSPAQPWLEGSAAARDLWRRLLPSTGGTGTSLVIPEDFQVMSALNNLPAVQLPPVEGLFGLLLAYIVLIGPVNYIVLGRLDRREWAWLTMPVLVVIFVVASYTVGTLLRGTDVIINEVAIVRGSPGSQEALGQVYVGVFSPSRQTYEVRVERDALLSNPRSQQDSGSFEQPLDVLFGEPSRLRNYQVGFGTLRGFRAETTLAVPALESDLRFVDGRLQGSVTNGSTAALHDAALVYGGAVAILDTLEPGQTEQIDLKVVGLRVNAMPLSERLFDDPFSGGGFDATTHTRRAVIDQVTGWGSGVDFGGGGGNGNELGQGPMLVAWQPEPALGVTLTDQPTTTIGQTLFVMPLALAVEGDVVFPAGLIDHTVLESQAVDVFDHGTAFSLGRGTMTVSFQPSSLDGRFEVEGMRLALTQGDGAAARGNGEAEVRPLPESRQPSQDDPLSGGPDGPDVGEEPTDPGDGLDPREPEEFFDGLPRVQLFDREADQWVEFEAFEANTHLSVPEPGRYVDETGSLLVRFVNRQDNAYFQLLVELEGAVL